MTYSEKKKLLFHYILRNNRQYEGIINPNKMMEVNKNMYSIQESILLHPNTTAALLLKGAPMDIGYGSKLITLEPFAYEGKIIGKVCFSRITGNIYFSCLED